MAQAFLRHFFLNCELKNGLNIKDLQNQVAVVLKVFKCL